MTEKLEDKLANIQIGIEEIKSCIIILNQSIKNEYDPANLNDINNVLELLLTKINKIIKETNEISYDLFENKNNE